MDETSEPTPRRPIVRGAPAILLTVALGGLAFAAHVISQLGADARRPSLQMAESGGAGGANATDSPGAAALYGFERDELTRFTPRELIDAALQNTTLDAIDADARRGDALGRALMCLARAYGKGLPKNLFIARSACEAAEAGGSALATYQLSLFMRDGDGGYRESAAAANRALRRAADAGDPRAQTDLAAAAIQAGRVREGYDALIKAADQGYRPAEIALGRLYAEGRGVAQDDRTALMWFERAAEAGSAEGLRAMGEFYETGKGVAQDYRLARAQYAQASELGDGEASLRLSRLWAQGLGGPADQTEAHRLQTRAAAQGAHDPNTDLIGLSPG